MAAIFGSLECLVLRYTIFVTLSRTFQNLTVFFSIKSHECNKKIFTVSLLMYSHNSELIWPTVPKWWSLQ